MKRHFISSLARAFGLSRSTLLYYDKIGLLRPTGRTASGYRFYSSKDAARLKRICNFRQAGLTLEEIQVLLASRGRPCSKVIEKRINETAKSIVDLRNKQQVLAGMLKRITHNDSAPVNKKMWVEMLRAAGMDENGMQRWHSEFEERAPEAHHEFLASLGITETEIAQIREWSRKGFQERL